MQPDYDMKFEAVDKAGPIHLGAVRILSEQLNAVHAQKERVYKGSWAKRGIMGIWFTIARPWDRMENLFARMQGEGVSWSDILSRTTFDALMDVSLYCLKVAALIATMSPETYVSWQQEMFPDRKVASLIASSDVEEELPF